MKALQLRLSVFSAGQGPFPLSGKQLSQDFSTGENQLLCGELFGIAGLSGYYRPLDFTELSEDLPRSVLFPDYSLTGLPLLERVIGLDEHLSINPPQLGLVNYKSPLRVPGLNKKRYRRC